MGDFCQGSASPASKFFPLEQQLNQSSALAALGKKMRKGMLEGDLGGGRACFIPWRFWNLWTQDPQWKWSQKLLANPTGLLKSGFFLSSTWPQQHLRWKLYPGAQQIQRQVVKFMSGSKISSGLGLSAGEQQFEAVVDSGKHKNQSSCGQSVCKVLSFLSILGLSCCWGCVINNRIIDILVHGFVRL